jgi:hypothetical protein
VKQDAPTPDALQMRHTCRNEHSTDAFASMLWQDENAPYVTKASGIRFPKSREGTRDDVATSCSYRIAVHLRHERSETATLSSIRQKLTSFGSPILPSVGSAYAHFGPMKAVVLDQQRVVGCKFYGKHLRF